MAVAIVISETSTKTLANRVFAWVTSGILELAAPDTPLTESVATAEIIGMLDVSSLPRDAVADLRHVLRRIVEREDPTFTSPEGHEKYTAEVLDLLRMLDSSAP